MYLFQNILDKTSKKCGASSPLINKKNPVVPENQINRRRVMNLSPESVKEEIYAKLILYNFCELITGAIVVEKKDRKYSYRINFSIAIAICTEFLRRSCASPPIDVIALIGRELIAVRPDRRNPRYLRARTATTFQYR